MGVETARRRRGGWLGSQAAMTRLLQIALTLLSIATAAALAWFGGWLVARQFTEGYKDSPLALVGGSLIAVAAAISVSLGWASAERHRQRPLLAGLAAVAPVLLALTALLW